MTDEIKRMERRIETYKANTLDTQIANARRKFSTHVLEGDGSSSQTHVYWRMVSPVQVRTGYQVIHLEEDGLIVVAGRLAPMVFDVGRQEQDSMRALLCLSNSPDIDGWVTEKAVLGMRTRLGDDPAIFQGDFHLASMQLDLAHARASAARDQYSQKVRDELIQAMECMVVDDVPGSGLQWLGWQAGLLVGDYFGVRVSDRLVEAWAAVHRLAEVLGLMSLEGDR